ncbi:AAA family ATPase [Inquilinus limosus]|uniref:Shikimate kinase n=1 Tax=Inquilinus limosus MP06 TaxID=1398085 RepID=A0A0A0DAD5_9PROT|nr:AAA family ATPase [Inquilinus limosus]KGM35094.1 shikimate kinase [Inquilinus limosus MP06]
MKTVLITGMSGSGKTAVIRELAARGHDTRDLDTPEWSEWVDAAPGDDLTPGEGKDWVWREDRLDALLAAPRDRTLFLSGTSETMGRFLPRIDLVILLSAPVETLLERMAARTDGYGRTGEERRRAAELVALVEPLLRQSADHEIDTRRPVAETVDAILRLT